MPVRVHRLGACLFAAAVLSTPLAGAAGTSASASLTSFTWKLIDLNPDDAIAPSISLQQSTVTWSQRSNGPAPSVDWKQGYTTTEIVNLTGSARTSIDAGSAHAWAQASNFTSAFHGWSTDNLVFELSPYTAIEFSGLAEVNSAEAGSSRTSGWVMLEGNLYEQGGGAIAALGGPRPGPISSFKLSLDSRHQTGAQWLTGRLSSGASAARGDFNLQAVAEVNLKPVPEPATWTMLAAGLGLIWRRRAACRPA